MLADCIFYRFVLGPYEENQYIQRRSEQAGISDQGESANIPIQADRVSSSNRKNNKNFIFHLVTQALRVYRKLVHRIKCLGRHQLCPHPFSCFYYTMQVKCYLFYLSSFLNM